MTDLDGFHYDRTFEHAMQGISHSIPDGEIIVVSNLAPHLAYLTERDTVIPWGLDSKASLVSAMRESGWNYLVVIDGRSSAVLELRDLFSREGREALGSDFDEIATYNSDLLEFHVFKLRASG
jgi:hypothetical protein